MLVLWNGFAHVVVMLQCDQAYAAGGSPTGHRHHHHSMLLYGLWNSKSPHIPTIIKVTLRDIYKLLLLLLHVQQPREEYTSTTQDTSWTKTHGPGQCDQL